MDVRDQIKARLPLDEVIGETVVLKPAGRNSFKGLCPFHDEKTPSFHVDTEKGRYRCYGCDANGDLLEFVQETQNLDFRAALELLGRRAGVEGERQPRSAGSRHAAAKPNVASPTPLQPVGWIADLVAQAHRALVRQETGAARAAFEHFSERGLAHLIDELRLGIVDETVRVPQAGGKMKGFRDRAVVPTLAGGEAIWFKARDVSGRTAEELKAAGVNKYDGPLGSIPAPYNPDGLERAAKTGFLVSTEGEIDAASILAAYGPDYPVIGLPGGNHPQGWAERVAKIKGVTHYLVMDADKAGARKAESVQKTLSGLGVRCYIIQLPKGDLNELLVSEGAEGLVAQVNELMETATRDSTSDLLYVRETWLAELDARANRPSAVYTTGLQALDDLLEGGYTEGLHLLGGITGGGKTSLALQVATHNAAAGRPVVYATYEQSRLELWARVASGLTGVPYKAIKRGTYDDYGQQVLTSSVLKGNKAWSQLESISRNLKIVEGGDALSRSESAYTVEVLAQTAQAIEEEYGAPPLVIIDYLQRAPAPPELRIRDVRERVGYIAGLLQVSLAREVGCPVLALSSIGRAFYNLQKIPGLEERIAAFKEAGEIEYTAYTSLLVYGLPEDQQDRAQLRPGMMDAYRPMTLDLVKNREGGIGQVGVKWHTARGSWAGAVALKGKA